MISDTRLDEKWGQVTLPKAQQFARQGMADDQSASTRLAATQLNISIRELGEAIAERVLHIGSDVQTDTVFWLFLEREQ